MKLTAALVVVSDTASKDPTTDRCEPVLRDVFDKACSETVTWEVCHFKIIPDSTDSIQSTVIDWTDSPSSPNLIVTSGGTGFATRDHTPEAISRILHKHAPGLVHGMLAASLAVTPFGIMSRPVAGVRNRTIILTLPGSPKGARENLEAIIKLLGHACQQAAGVDSRVLHAGGTKKLEADAGISRAHGSSSEALKSSTAGHHHHHDHGHGHGHGHGRGHGHHGPRAHTRPEDRPAPNDPLAGPVGRHRDSPYPMISVDAALTLIQEHVPDPISSTQPLSINLIGRVLAADVKAAESVPAYRASIVDGYAVVAGSNISTKGVFPVAMISHAKPSHLSDLQPGQIARITTGAPLPAGANAVAMVEDTVISSTTDDGAEEKEVEILTADITPGENVREIGSDVQAGAVILQKGEGISAIGGDFGLLASVGTREVSVYQRPVVSVLSTGDEIVSFDRPGALSLGEVRDTNRPTLLQAIKNTGFEGIDLGIASDVSGDLEAKLREALRASDVVITSGGVSMGELDLLKPTIERKLGGTIHFGRVSMKPGKPTTFATVPIKTASGERRDKVIFSLPGNPASAVVTYHLFVLPALHKMAGVKPEGLPKVKVRMAERARCDGKRQEYVRAQVSANTDGLMARTTGGQRSSRIGSFKGANALLAMPVKDGFVEAGDAVTALMMGAIVSEL